MKIKLSSVIKYTLSLAAAAVLVYFAFRGVDWGAFWQGLKQTSWGWMAVYAVASIGALFFRRLRWSSILKPLDASIRPLTVWDANNIGNIVNVVIPSVGEFTRCGIVSTKKATYDKAFGTIACERLCDTVAVIILFIVTIAVDRGTFSSFFAENIWGPLSEGLSFSLGWIVGGVVLLLAAFIWAMFHWREKSRFCGKVAGAISGLGAGFVSFSKMEHKSLFALYTLGIWVMYIIMYTCVLKAIPATAHLPFTAALFITAVGNVASIIPVPGGIGAYHYLVALTIESLFGLTHDVGILYATLNHEAHAILIIILGAISWIAWTLRRRTKAA